MRNVLRFAVRVLATMAIIVAGAALIAGVLVPRVAGGTPYTVLTGSNKPTLPPGTLIAVRPSHDIQVGDIITFQLRPGEPEVATHRVIGVGTSVAGERVYVTKGDASEAADLERVRDVQVRGELWYRVPYLGYVSRWFTGGQREGIALLLAGGLIGYAVWQLVAARRDRAAGLTPDADEEHQLTGPEGEPADEEVAAP